MIVKIQLADSVYKKLVSGNSRIRGSIGLVSPTEGNFNEYRRWREKSNTRYIRLPHGRVSVNDESVRLTLRISADEANIIPSQIILDESERASDFVDVMFDRY